MKTCGTCKWWDANAGLSVAFGVCGKIQNRVMRGAMIVGPMCLLKPDDLRIDTDKNFGCLLHEEKGGAS